MWILALANAVPTPQWRTCGHVRIICAGVHALHLGYCLLMRPYRCIRDNVIKGVNLALLIAGLVSLGLEFYSVADEEDAGNRLARPRDHVGKLSLQLALTVVLMQLALRGLAELVLLAMGYRAHSQHLEWQSADHAVMRCSSRKAAPKRRGSSTLDTPSSPVEDHLLADISMVPLPPAVASASVAPAEVPLQKSGASSTADLSTLLAAGRTAAPAPRSPQLRTRSSAWRVSDDRTAGRQQRLGRSGLAASGRGGRVPRTPTEEHSASFTAFDLLASSAEVSLRRNLASSPKDPIPARSPLLAKGSPRRRARARPAAVSIQGAGRGRRGRADTTSRPERVLASPAGRGTPALDQSTTRLPEAPSRASGSPGPGAKPRSPPRSPPADGSQQQPGSPVEV
eukprot:TRINITY_DN18732_c0_g2_i1.p1 TRINITY_DN18732_c0_g2~~TRINITY_DN18732_c0_g2_i1.p1  ORF type:complete len:397 (+),score=64.07 TRINITY_DN18732_c0_g2_i1:541-1731(+)